MSTFESSTSPDASELSTRQTQVWAQICLIAEGLVVAPVISAFVRRGAHTGLAKSAGIDSFKGNPGFVAVALHALAQQGRWPLTIDDDAFERFREIPKLLRCCDQIIRTGQSAIRLEDLAFIPKGAAGFEFLAFLAAPAILRLSDRGVLDQFSPEELRLDPHQSPELHDSAIFAVFLQLGWVSGAPESPILTIEGRMAAAFAGQMRYPLSYLPMLQSIENLLFGTPKAAPDSFNAIETHLDRAADIRFSTEVFEQSCAEPLKNSVLPLFCGGPDKARPDTVIDVGCGEASMLVALGRMIRDDPDTQGCLPLLIAVENNQVARDAAKRTLAESGMQHLVIAGDIAKPRDIAKRLSGHDIRMTNALHVNKSVIHDRALGLVSPACTDRFDPNEGAFAYPNGSLADSDTVHSDLIAFFRNWAPYIGEFGMISLEPHRLTLPRALELRGRTLVPMMEALHGFSCQYLTSFDELEDAVSQAEMRMATRIAIGSHLTGHAHMSCNHILPNGSN